MLLRRHAPRRGVSAHHPRGAARYSASDVAANLKFVLSGSPALQANFRAALINAQDLREAWDQIEAEFNALQAAQFRRGGPPSGRKWKRNSPGWRRRKGGKPPGTFTGELGRSLSRSRVRGRIYKRGQRVMTIGTDLPYAGSFASERRLFRVITRQVRLEWGELLAEHIGEPLLGRRADQGNPVTPPAAPALTPSCSRASKSGVG